MWVMTLLLSFATLFVVAYMVIAWIVIRVQINRLSPEELDARIDAGLERLAQGRQPAEATPLRTKLLIGAGAACVAAASLGLYLAL